MKRVKSQLVGDVLKPLQKVKSRQSPHVIKQASKLVRTTFETSREMDFFSQKELVTQTGHAVEEWPLVAVKELIDNALDACEEADIVPVIEVTADARGISVRDNGPGLPESTLDAAKDFSIRASNREAYVAPDRGAQGNALKTILPMPAVLDREHGRLIIEAHSKQHVLQCGAHPISQRPVIHDDETKATTKGTMVRLEWSRRKNDDGKAVWPFGDDLDLEGELADAFRHIVEGMAIFNPHVTINLNWFGRKKTWKATNPDWQKWKPNRPTSAHWYELQHLERLIGAYVTHDQETGTDRLVSEFVAEFDRLSGSQKRAKVLRDANMHRARLSELIVDNRFDSERIAVLLASMQRHTRPINPQLLGMIGEEHLRTRLLDMGVVPESFGYSRKLSNCKESPSDPGDKASFTCHPPWVLESAFGWLGNGASDERRIFAGANWSAAIHNPFRTFGSTGEGLEAALTDMRVGQDEPVVFVLHLAHPRVEYTDRGKSALVIGGPA